MKYKDKSQKPQCCSMMFLLWRNHNDYKHISGRIIVNGLDRSLLNPYPFLHQFLFRALQKILLTLTRGPGNPPSRSRTILKQLPGTAMTWVTRSSPFGGRSALRLSTTGRAGLIGVLWGDVEIVDQQATVRGGAGRGWLMTWRQDFGIPTNLERFDLGRGQCYDTHLFFSFSSHMLLIRLISYYLFPFDMHRLHVILCWLMLHLDGCACQPVAQFSLTVHSL